MGSVLPALGTTEHTDVLDRSEALSVKALDDLARTTAMSNNNNIEHALSLEERNTSLQH